MSQKVVERNSTNFFILEDKNCYNLKHSLFLKIGIIQILVIYIRREFFFASFILSEQKK